MRVQIFALVIAALILGAAAPAVGGPGGGVAFTGGWSLFKEGEAEGTIEQDATYPVGTAAHLLRITETKEAGPLKGRVGASNAAAISVQADKWYDITFSANTSVANMQPAMRPTIGLVFSLESKDGTVLARTTLPEIGPGRGGGGGRGRGAAGPTDPGTWNKYLVALHARGTDAAAHLTITPIEVTNVFLENITLVERK